MSKALILKCMMARLSIISFFLIPAGFFLQMDLKMLDKASSILAMSSSSKSSMSMESWNGF